ncbi:ABC transporter permease subunit [bacterium]|nr:ABC transporter permease subunit [bacterium]
MIYSVDPTFMDRKLTGQPLAPSWDYPGGTDRQGRDVLARLLVGARISLAVGVIAMVINLIIGVAIGVVSGWAYSSSRASWRFLDTVLTRIVDILYSIPVILIVVLLQVFVRKWIENYLASHGWDRANIPLLLTPDLLCVYIALGVTNWLTMARLARGEVINQAGSDYVMAARSLGQKSYRILFFHILPNCIGPLAVASTLAIPQAIFTESFLAFVGIGVSAPQASWGTMASDGLAEISNAPHLLILPAVSISITMLAFNLFGDGLRDALDPSSR